MSAPAVFRLMPDIPLCQTDLPLDWYQPALRRYAEEFLALPDRTPESVLPWLDGYVRPALEHFGNDLELLAHFYMGGEIVKLVERYGGRVGDSYQFATHARAHPEKSVIVASAVHFMAEAVAILAHEHQQVWITNPKAGCTMEMMATDDMVLPCADQLLERYGDDLLVVAYMNTSGRIKALAGRTGGSACTSSNAPAVMRWALDQGRKVMFVPDEHLGRNTAVRIGLTPDQMAVLPDPREGPIEITDASVDGGLAALDRADVLLWRSFCGVHTIFTAEMVRWWRGQGWEVLIHPESPLEAVQEADGAGSTNFLWERIMNAPAGARIAVGTEGHFVRNAAEQAKLRGVEVRHLAEVPGFRQAGCGCATMSRNDPPHLAGTLDLLRRGEAPEINHVLPGDTIDSATMQRDRLGPAERAEIAAEARRALDRMIEIVG